MEHLVILGFVFLNLFMVIGAVDLFYYHIWKYRLHTRPESRYEHKLHMLFAFIMVPVAFLLFYADFGGYALWAGAIAVVSALGVEVMDVFSENDSRASIGGLTTGEYSLHVLLTILKVAAFTFIFASKPAAAWNIDSQLYLGTYGSMGELIAMKVMAGSFLVGILHLALLNPRIASINLKAVCEYTGCSRSACCSQ